jgi:hypothetical protein
MNYHHENLLNHYKSFLQSNYGAYLPDNNIQNESNPSSSQSKKDSQNTSDPVSSLLHGKGHKPQNINFNEVKVFENDTIVLYVNKAFQQRQKRFRLQDTLFHIKVKVKNNVKTPLLRELVDVLQEAFTFILKHIQTFFPKEDHNVAYLTLYQEPMINGLNTGTIKNVIFYNQVILKVIFTTTA